MTFGRAGVAKLEYARDLGSRGRETVRVQIPPSAPSEKEGRRYSKNQRRYKFQSLKFGGYQNPEIEPRDPIFTDFVTV